MHPLDPVLVVFALALLTAFAGLLRDTDDGQRAVIADLGFYAFLGAVIVLGMRLSAPSLFDVVLAASLTGFLSTVAYARLVDRRGR